MGSEETIQFTELKGIECMVQTFPLEKTNDAYGRISLFGLNHSSTN